MFCTNCGTNINIQSKSSKKGLIALIILIAAIVIFLIVAIFAFSFLSSKNKSPEDIVEKLEKAYNKQDIEYIYDTLPDYYEEWLKLDLKYYYDSETEFWEEIFYYDLDVDPKLFSSIKTDFKIVDKERSSGTDIEEWEYELQYYYDDDFSISAICDLRIEITYTLQFNKKYCKEELGNDYKEILEDEYGRNWEKGVIEEVFLDASVFQTNDEWFLFFYDAF